MNSEDFLNSMAEQTILFVELISNEYVIEAKHVYMQILQLIRGHIQLYSPEVKAAGYMQIGFLLLYPTSSFVENKALDYFVAAQALLNLLADDKLIKFYQELIGLAEYIIDVLQKLDREVLKETYLIKMKDFNQERLVSDLKKDALRAYIKKAGGINKVIEKEILIYAQIWQKYKATMRVFKNLAMQERTPLVFLINAIFENHLQRVLHYHDTFLVENFISKFDIIIKEPFCEEVKNAKLFLEFSIDVIEINSMLGYEYKLNNYLELSLDILLMYRMQRGLLYDINMAQEHAVECSKKLAEELLRAARVKKDYFKHLPNKNAQLQVNHNRNTKVNKIKSVEPCSLDTDKKESVNRLDSDAYALFLAGKFKEAIKSYEQQLVKKEVLTKDNRLKQVEICSDLGECYKFWSSEQLKFSRLKALLEQKALGYYDLAVEQISIGLQEHPEDSDSFQEWTLRAHFVHMLRESLNPKSYIEELTAELRSIEIKESKSLFTGFEPMPVTVSSIADEDHSEMELLLPKEAVQIIQRHHDAGYSCYLVGGFVRDYLINKPAADVDMVTTAHPEISKKLAGQGAELIGSKHPIVRMKLNSANNYLDIAPLRGVWTQDRPVVAVNLDNNMLVSMVFTDSVTEDCMHRDSTVNALYYNLGTKQLLDPTGHGLEDLKAKKVRLIGDPSSSIKSDPLRIFRVIRLSTSLNFSIDQLTEQALAENKALAAHVTPARLLIEFHKMLFNSKGIESFVALDNFGLLDFYKSTMRGTQIDGVDFRTLMHSILTEIMTKNLSENNAWLFFLAGLFWPRVQDLYLQKENCENKEIVCKALEPFYGSLKNNKINLKLQQIWSQATNDSVRFAELAVDEYTLIDKFKKIIKSSSWISKPSFFKQKHNEKNIKEEAIILSDGATNQVAPKHASKQIQNFA